MQSAHRGRRKFGTSLCPLDNETLGWISCAPVKPTHCVHKLAIPAIGGTVRQSVCFVGMSGLVQTAVYIKAVVTELVGTPTSRWNNTTPRVPTTQWAKIRIRDSDGSRVGCCCSIFSLDMRSRQPMHGRWVEESSFSRQIVNMIPADSYRVESGAWMAIAGDCTHAISSRSFEASSARWLDR